MSEPGLVLVHDGGDAGVEIAVNFGIFAGREATQAEIERLGEALVPELETVDIVSEQRYRFDRQMEGTVYQVRVEAPRLDTERRDRVVEAVEAWARDCIAERRLMAP